jgi:cytochrome c
MKIQIPHWPAVCCLTAAALAAVAIAPVVSRSAPPADQPPPAGSDFSPYVSKDGAISRPVDYREKFLHLGTWAVAKKLNEPVFEMHNVYARLEDIQAFRRDGKFPDGAALVKEITNVAADQLTTGRSSWSTNDKIWFVMIKDSKGRFPNNSLWGDGWGWALFTAKEPARNVATDYTTDCRTCHVPARQDDWIYVRGYPLLREHAAAR